MSVVMKVVFSLSLSGSLLICVLLFCKPLFRNVFSRRWQYYIWLVVIARLLLPVAPEVSLVGKIFSEIDQGYQTELTNVRTSPVPTAGGNAATVFPMEENIVIQYHENRQGGAGTAVSEVSVGNMARKLLGDLWIPWLVIALLLLIRKITVYQSFVKYIKAGCREVSDTARLDRLAQIGEQAGVRRPVELYSNSLVSSPLLVGFFRPCIILPAEDLGEVDFTHIVWHELIHFKRKDMFYKWLVQLTVCLHWFDPLVWLMGREINRACEFACDEAVLAALGEQERCAYGDTLLRAMEMGGGCRNFPVSVTLNEGAELLKERLGAIMVFKKRSRTVMIVSAVFAGVMLTGATAAGAYVEPVRTAKIMTRVSQATSSEQEQAESEDHRNPNTPGEDIMDENAGSQNAGNTISRTTISENVQKQGTGYGINDKSLDDLAERYYQMGLLVQFEAVFSALDETAQQKWLDTVYADDDIAFFSVALDGLRSSSPLFGE